MSGLGNFPGFAEQLGEALGRGIARGLNQGLMGRAAAGAPAPAAPAPRRGRPPKSAAAAAAPAKRAGQVPADRRCTVEGCTNEVRSKGLCSKHYQAERRRLAKAA